MDKHVQQWVKRFIDLVGAITILVMLSPLLILIAILIKLTSPGPVLFLWKVVGKDGQPFTSYKFRSMVVGAEQQEKALRASDQNPLKDILHFKLEDDPRITGVGKFLRKYSLDELPNLFSVVKGDMSLVGPRPSLIFEVEQFKDWHRRRMDVKPGVTGLWQVSGKDAITNVDDIVKLDLWYIDNWTLWLDIKILLKTIPVALLGQNR